MRTAFFNTLLARRPGARGMDRQPTLRPILDLQLEMVQGCDAACDRQPQSAADLVLARRAVEPIAKTAQRLG